MYRIILLLLLSGLALAVEKPAVQARDKGYLTNRDSPEWRVVSVTVTTTVTIGNLAPVIYSSHWMTPDGKAPELKNRVCLIDFWYTGCGSCLRGMPDLNLIISKYAKRGLVVIAPVLENADVVNAVLREHRLTVNAHIMANAQDLSDKYGVFNYPTMFLVGKDQRILWKGHSKDENFYRILDVALNE